jgi:hypothetical protein
MTMKECGLLSPASISALDRRRFFNYVGELNYDVGIK